MDARQITTFIPRQLIRIYQILRAGSVRRCRFFPSCSEYTLQAFEAEGFARGLGLGLLRILKCHPWHPGGYHPISH